MTAKRLEQERLACWPMGQLEYVVESRRNGHTETWFILRPHRDVASSYHTTDMSYRHGCRIVVEAQSLRPVGVLARDTPAPTPSALGHNPYFDLPPN